MTSTLLTEEQLRYERLLSYYKNQDVYKEIQEAYTHAKTLIAPPSDDLFALRNPAHTVVEFHASKLWGEPVEESFKLADDTPDVLKQAVSDVLKSSNWAQEKQPVARNYTATGDMFLRSGTDRTRVFIERIDPRDVITFDKNKLGHFTYIRLDIPKARRNKDGEKERYIRTEVWDKDSGRVRIWEHTEPKGCKLKDLESPKETWLLSIGDEDNALGYDFLPFKHAKFKDIGEERGQGAFEHACRNIDNANEKATRLHRRLFPRRARVFTAPASGPDGTPLKAIKLDTSGAKRDPTESELAAGVKELKIDDEVDIALPGGYRVESLIPQEDFSNALQAIQDDLRFLEDLLPELKLRRMVETLRDASGVAIKYQLADLIDKVTEARSNALAAISGALGMCFTLAQIHNIAGFESLGSFESGDFDFAFEERDIFPVTGLEKAEVESKELDVLEKKGRVLALPVSELRKEAGIEDIQPINADDVPPVEPNGTSTTTEEILRQLGVGSGQ